MISTVTTNSTYAPIDTLWWCLSRNHHITLDIMEECCDMPWSLGGISCNPNLTMDFIYFEFDRITKSRISTVGELDCMGISGCLNIKLSEIEQHPGMPWSWLTISKHKDLTFDFITSVSTKFGKDDAWWSGLSGNPAITMDMITDNPQLPWRWGYVSRNPNLTIEMITAHMDKDWDWYKN